MLQAKKGRVRGVIPRNCDLTLYANPVKPAGQIPLMRQIKKER